MEENLELEQELDAEVEDVEDIETEEEADFEDYSEEAETVESTEDDELEYDEDGNVIETTEENNEAAAQVEERDTNVTDNHIPTVSDEAKQIQTEREAILTDALKAMGIEFSNIDDGLIKLAAEAKGETPEEYAKKRTEARRNEEAQRVYREVMLERMVASDMNELHSLFPETKSISKFEDIPNCRRYAELRDKGLSVKEAYSAANSDSRTEAIMNSVKQQTINASKSHLKSNVPIASKDTSIKISRADMEQMRDLFPDKSDKELVALYKKTK